MKLNELEDYFDMKDLFIFSKREKGKQSVWMPYEKFLDN